MGLRLICSPHSLFNRTQRPPLIATNKARPVPSSSSSSSSGCCVVVVCSAESDSQQFEVDPEKARQALRDLDQQLQSFSTKRASPPKNKVEDMKVPRSEMRGEMTEISETLLANSAVLLFIFSIFYNVLFYTVIKPSIDVPLPTSVTSQTDSN